MITSVEMGLGRNSLGSGGKCHRALRKWEASCLCEREENGCTRSRKEELQLREVEGSLERIKVDIRREGKKGGAAGGREEWMGEKRKGSVRRMREERERQKMSLTWCKIELRGRHWISDYKWRAGGYYATSFPQP